MLVKKPNYTTHSREPFFKIARNLIKQDDIVLDIGAGNGSFSEYCGDMKMFLYEGNLENVEYLKRKFKNVYYGRLPNLPFDDNFFEVIHISHVVEHLQPEELYATLKEVDRCCKPGGAIVISTPLLSENFYDDLSHIKPYNPQVFIKYLCDPGNYTLGRPPISRVYSVEKLVYRLKERIFFQQFKNSNSFLKRAILSFYNTTRSIGLKQHIRTGYTIVLRKSLL